MLIQARSHGDVFDAAHLSEPTEDRPAVLTLLCSEPTTPVQACCTHTSTGCALGALVKDLFSCCPLILP